MKDKTLQEYAKIIVKLGVNVQKGQDVIIRCSVDQAPLARYLVQACYQAKARKVEMQWVDTVIGKERLLHESIPTLSEFPAWEKAKLQDQVKQLPVRIYIEDDDPDGLQGVPMNKLVEPSKKRYPQLKPFRDQMEGKYQWTIVGMPSKAWAKKMYPKDSEEKAMAKLEKAILHTMRMDTKNPEAAWKKHLSNLKKKAAMMNRYHFKSLHYTSSNGTDFTVGLHPKHIWCVAEEKQANGITGCVNMPTEEIFTAPDHFSAEGTVVASKPLSYNGNLIEDFAVTFHKGKAIKVKAKKGQKHFEEMIKMDKGSCYLGEVALVPYDSPINQIGTLFYSTLYDENAACHIALGAGIKEGIEGSDKMTLKQAIKAGHNDSSIHTDFMIGTKDLKIVGTTPQGKEVVVFKNGVWAI